MEMSSPLRPGAVDALLGAAVTTAATTAAALLVSRAQAGHAAAGLNATSHILWGDRAARVNRADLKHTASGALLNAGAMLAWSTVHQLLPRARAVPSALAKGAFVSALAYVTDYFVVPKRLTPGFEKRFDTGGLATIYGVLAGALALGSLLALRRTAQR